MGMSPDSPGGPDYPPRPVSMPLPASGSIEMRWQRDDSPLKGAGEFTLFRQEMIDALEAFIGQIANEEFGFVSYHMELRYHTLCLFESPNHCMALQRPDERGMPPERTLRSDVIQVIRAEAEELYRALRMIEPQVRWGVTAGFGIEATFHRDILWENA